MQFYAIFEQPLKCHDWFLLSSLSLARKPHALFFSSTLVLSITQPRLKQPHMSVEHEDGQTRKSIFPCQQHYPTENRTQQKSYVARTIIFHCAGLNR